MNINSPCSENSTNRRLGTFYFSHSEALLPFLGLLGLYRDEDVPTHDNFADMRERYYRTSLIGSFSAGVAFVLFDCQGEQKVLTLHQEVPVQLPKCSDLLCDWEQFNTQFQVFNTNPSLRSDSLLYNCFNHR